jgi:hypothetical protein
MAMLQIWPSQLEPIWPTVWEHVSRAFPPHLTMKPETEANTLRSLLEGSLTLWVWLDDTDRAGLLMILTPLYEGVNDQRNLLVFALTSFEGFSFMANAQRVIKALQTYARAQGCGKLVAYTENPVIVKLTERTGGSVRHFLEWEL